MPDIIGPGSSFRRLSPFSTEAKELWDAMLEEIYELSQLRDELENRLAMLTPLPPFEGGKFNYVVPARITAVYPNGITGHQYDAIATDGLNPDFWHVATTSTIFKLKGDFEVIPAEVGHPCLLISETEGGGDGPYLFVFTEIFVRASCATEGKATDSGPATAASVNAWWTQSPMRQNGYTAQEEQQYALLR